MESYLSISNSDQIKIGDIVYFSDKNFNMKPVTVESIINDRDVIVSEIGPNFVRENLKKSINKLYYRRRKND